MDFPCILKHPEGGKPILCIAPNVTADGRTWYGVKWVEVQARARKWWDKTGRKEMTRTKNDLVHQDTGVDSAILRGQHWATLNGRERAHVTSVYEREQLRRDPEFAQMLTEFMVYNFPEELDQGELAKHLAAGPAANEHTDQLLEGTLYESPDNG